MDVCWDPFSQRVPRIPDPTSRFLFDPAPAGQNLERICHAAKVDAITYKGMFDALFQIPHSFSL